MKTLEYTYEDVDKSEWGEGPWQAEVDKIQFLDEETGLPCIIKRNHMGTWCGYVGVSEGHPAYDRGYNQVDDQINVHGGLTYSGRCSPHEEGEEAHAICHVVEGGEDDAVFWLGFDCGHGGDLIPRMAAENRRRYKETGDEIWNDMSEVFGDRATYRDQSYVTAETRSLAKQLAAMV